MDALTLARFACAASRLPQYTARQGLGAVLTGHVSEYDITHVLEVVAVLRGQDDGLDRLLEEAETLAAIVQARVTERDAAEAAAPPTQALAI